MTILILKQCKKCGEEKPLDLFCKNKLSLGGFERACKQCVAVYQKKYYDKNKADWIKRNEIWEINNRDKKKECARLWGNNNKDKLREYCKKNVGQLTDGYVGKVLVTRKTIRREIIPIELIEVKRLQITLYRLIKEKQAAA